MATQNQELPRDDHDVETETTAADQEALESKLDDIVITEDDDDQAEKAEETVEDPISEAVPMVELKDIPRPVNVTGIRFEHRGREKSNIEDITLSFQQIKHDVNLLSLQSSGSGDNSGRAVRMSFTIPKDGLKDYSVNDLSLLLRYDASLCQGMIPRALASDETLCSIFKYLQEGGSVELFFDEKRTKNLRRMGAFCSLVQGKSQMAPGSKEKGPSKSVTWAFRTESQYEKTWIDAIDMEHEAYNESLQQKLGGKVGLTLEEGESVRVFYNMHHPDTHLLEDLDENQQFTITTPKGKALQAYASAEQVTRYNQEGILTINVHNFAVKHIKEILASGPQAFE
ncbi:hypothetical protein ABW21_db0206133 [Orbilia brochopaga]|nr:hypothetical protein ABW21_db0206133 [Drechslerella brochopaga]